MAAPATDAVPDADPMATVPITGVPGSGTYRVWAFPHADPNDGDRSLVVDPADPVSSPFGWHDTDGVSGAESAQTVGNNVDAYLDILNDDTAVETERATGTNGVFDFPSISAKMVFLGTPAVLRDGDFDAGLILHEYTHGISHRLTGGRLTVGCRSGDEQTGEGWSDFFALTMTHDPNRSVQRSRGLGPYIRFTGVDGPGNRLSGFAARRVCHGCHARRPRTGAAARRVDVRPPG
jgi:hypothetical protein